MHLKRICKSRNGNGSILTKRRGFLKKSYFSNSKLKFLSKDFSRITPNLHEQLYIFCLHCITPKEYVKTTEF